MVMKNIEKKNIDNLRVLRDTVKSKLDNIMILNGKIIYKINDDEEYGTLFGMKVWSLK